MSSEVVAEAMIRSPRDGRPRRGRGFSREEIRRAGLTVHEARRIGLMVDVRRKTVYDENVEAVRQLLADLETMGPGVTAPASDKGRDAAVRALSFLKEVTEADAEALVAAGVRSLEDLAYCDISAVVSKTGIDQDRLTSMVKAALKKV